MSTDILHKTTCFYFSFSGSDFCMAWTYLLRSYFWMMIFDEQEEGEPNDDDTKIQLYNT